MSQDCFLLLVFMMHQDLKTVCEKKKKKKSILHTDTASLQALQSARCHSAVAQYGHLQ